jgi:hypothetical protein
VIDPPAPWRTAPVGDRRFALALWLTLLAAAFACSLSVGRLVELPERPLIDLVDGLLPLSLVALGLVLLIVVWRRIDARHWTTWWDPAARPDGGISWNDVRCLVLDDPLKNVPRLRGAYFLARIPICVLGLALFLTFGRFILALVDKPWLPDFVRGDPKGGDAFGALTKPGQNLTAYVALLVAGLTILFTYLQLRAKVRADNRQAWIDRARSHLGTVTSLGSLHSYTAKANAHELWLKFAPLRLELELMLNSSEKDHRLLEFLLHELAVLREGGEPIDDTKYLKEVVEKASGMPFDEWLPNSQNRVQLITYILRLSHVVLKREWERVKHTR